MNEYGNANDATVVCNAPDIRTDRDNHGYAEQGISHCHGSILNDLSLPKYSSHDAQSIGQFLSGLNSYFRGKNVPESVRLP
jgi:hypothetical protein